jgi:hypothetical protein
MVISDVAARCRCSRVFAVLPDVYSLSLPVRHVTASSVCLSVHCSPGAGLSLMTVAALVLASTSATPAHYKSVGWSAGVDEVVPMVKKQVIEAAINFAFLLTGRVKYVENVKD